MTATNIFYNFVGFRYSPDLPDVNWPSLSFSATKDLSPVTTSLITDANRF